MAPTPGIATPSRFDAVRSALTTAEHDFLHAILGGAVDLSWERYAALVAELRGKRAVLLHEVEEQLRADAPREPWLGLLYATERAKLGP